ncbi:MAG: sulfatase-like hydrolase/transferase [Clostridia bacterium]|nr:sulfatase-like hydrolase/transferase [Clostridia bacterium]
MKEKLKIAGKKTLEWLKINRLAVLYFVFAIIIEMMSVFAVEGNPIMSRPLIAIGLLLMITCLVLLTKRNKVRLIIYAILLGVQAILDLVFSVVYDMTGQYFDFGMLNLRNDAFATLEGLLVNFFAFYTGVFCCIIYVIYGLRMLRGEKHAKNNKRSRIFYGLLAMAGFATMGISVVQYYPSAVNKYDELLYGKSTGAYSSYGMMGNVVGEFTQSVILQDKSRLSEEEIENFIYNGVAEESPQFGVSKDNNVIVILAESLEWFAFMNALNGNAENGTYPNALGLTDAQLATLYPNLTKLYNNSVKMTNFHSREKTDISETLSIVGSYPTDAYINYDYSNNALPYTMPNLMKTYDSDMQSLSFHNGFKTFYNRLDAHQMFGMEFLYDMYDMEDMSNEREDQGFDETMHNYMEDGERNLDSEMIETCKELMFPTDKRFYTYITTITMHGVYYERKNLSDERKKLLEAYDPDFLKAYEEAEKADDDSIWENFLDLFRHDKENASSEIDKDKRVLFNYMTTALELDDAIGAMMNDLEKKGLLDNTTIAIFGDHNAYYQQLSNYVKDIYGFDTSNDYTDLYCVPWLIYDENLAPQTVDKFTCTADIVPTLLDLLGIHYYENIYYGNSVFTDRASVLYSRAYGIFVGDGIVASSVNNITYKHSSITDAQIKAFKEEATALVQEIKHCDYIFKQDYFDEERTMQLFLSKMREINPTL